MEGFLGWGESSRTLLVVYFCSRLQELSATDKTERVPALMKLMFSLGRQMIRMERYGKVSIREGYLGISAAHQQDKGWREDPVP